MHIICLHGMVTVTAPKAHICSRELLNNFLSTNPGRLPRAAENHTRRPPLLPKERGQKAVPGAAAGGCGDDAAAPSRVLLGAHETGGQGNVCSGGAARLLRVEFCRRLEKHRKHRRGARSGPASLQKGLQRDSKASARRMAARGERAGEGAI